MSFKLNSDHKLTITTDQVWHLLDLVSNDNTLKSDITMRKDIGVVITTHGNNGIYVRQCLECFLRNTPNAYIVFFVNA